MTILRFILSFLFLSSPIITRHDIDDQKFLDFAKDENFQSFAWFSDGGGTLISPDWILTARHVAQDLVIDDPVFLRNDTLKIYDIVLYPELNNFTPDIALIKLDRPVRTVSPANIFRESPKINSLIQLIGRGDHGTGNTGPVGLDYKIRAATNLIDSVDENHITFQFDSPESDRSTNLEGISGPGDSGGPAYLIDENRIRLVGVSSAQDLHGQETEGLYGVREFYVNVSNFTDWIDETLKGHRYLIIETTDDQLTAVLNDEKILSIRKNGTLLSPPQYNSYRDLIFEKVTSTEISESELPSEERVPAFIRFIFELAHKNGITDQLQSVNFSISPTSLMIENQEMNDTQFQQALIKYREIFGRDLKDSFKFELD